MAFTIIYSISALSLMIALWMTRWVLSKPEGPPAMREVSTAIREGAEGFLATQYGAIFRYALLEMGGGDWLRMGMRIHQPYACFPPPKNTAYNIG